MTKQEKEKLVEELSASIAQSQILYIADTSALTVETSNNLRRRCYSKGVSLRVVKNTLLKKALERVEGRDYSELMQVLVGTSAIMMADTPNMPAKVIKDFRKKLEKPSLKGAWIDEAVYLGDKNLDTLANIKSKEELIGDVIGLLQSPAKNVVSALQSSKSTLAGLVKTLQERAA